MTLSHCCKRKCSNPNPCKCSPCNQEYSGQCSPVLSSIANESPAIQLYTPVLASAPLSNKCCSCKEKAKKSLWQQLFGGSKCCRSTPVQKKKNECCCKQKKSSCNSEYVKPLCCKSAKPTPPPAVKHACCCRKDNIYRCKSTPKPCCPTPESVFRCHFYCNLENCGTKQSRHKCRCCSTTTTTTSEQTSDVPETTTDTTTDCEKTTYSYKFKNSDEVSNKSPIPSRRSSPLPKNSFHSFKKASYEDTKKVFEEMPKKSSEIKEPDRPIPKPARSNYHIGLTFTNTDTMYYKSNGKCPPKEEGLKYNDDGAESNGSSEKIIRLEIHQSDSNRDKVKHENREDIRSWDEEVLSTNSSKRRKISTSEEGEYYSQRKSSIDSRKNKENKYVDEYDNDGVLVANREQKLSSKNVEGNDLDKRVFEIITRLQNIEKKINSIGCKKENDMLILNTDRIKSEMSFQFRDVKNNDSLDRDGNYHRNKPKTVIEIRKCRSNSHSLDGKQSLGKKKYHSQYFDREPKNPKLVIELPPGNKVSHGFISVSSNRKVKNLDFHDSEWLEVANELKHQKHKNSPCYCYECVCKRVKCQ